MYIVGSPTSKVTLYNKKDDASQPAENWDKKIAFVDRVTDGFGKIQFIKEGLGGHKPAKVLKYSIYCDHVIDELQIDKSNCLSSKNHSSALEYSIQMLESYSLVYFVKDYLNGQQKNIYSQRHNSASAPLIVQRIRVSHYIY